jgi:hypothetical protein
VKEFYDFSVDIIALIGKLTPNRARRSLNPQQDIVMKLETLLNKAVKIQSDIKTKTIQITPKFAEECLKNFNNSNRPMAMGLARLYANEFLRGNWKINGEPFIFSVDSEGEEHLVSGQHRLAGLLLADKAIEKGQEWPVAQTEFDAVIIYGVQHDTADTVDTGKARNHNDVLFRDPWVDSIIPPTWNETVSKRKLWTKTLAGAARLVWLIEGGALVSSAPKFVISEMLSFLQNRHVQLGEFVSLVLDANDADADNNGLKMSLSYIAALVYVACVVEDESGEVSIDEATAETLDTFVNAVAVGSMPKGSPAHALTGYWNKLTSEPGSKDRDRDWVGPFVKACAAELNGESGLTAKDIGLTKKERDNYADFPIMFEGFHTACFERAMAAKAAKAERAESEKAEAKEESVPSAADEEVFVEEEAIAEPAAPTRVPAKRKPAKRSPQAKA